MNYTLLQDQPNVYPSVESYKSTTDSIIVNGLVETNTVTFPKFDISSIKTYDSISIRFLVEFNGEIWTSKTFYDDLQLAISENNPYFNLNNVPKVNIDVDAILTRMGKFSNQEEYAEVSVLSSIDTVEKVLKHMDWVVSDERALRSPENLGTWVVSSTPSYGTNSADINSTENSDIATETESNSEQSSNIISETEDSSVRMETGIINLLEQQYNTDNNSSNIGEDIL